MASDVIVQRAIPATPDIYKIPTPPTQAAALFIVVFFTVIALIISLLRIYIRLKTKTWGLDDWLVVGAMLFSLAMCPPFYIYIKLGYFGWNEADVPKFDPTPGLFWFYLGQLLYNPVLALVRASILVFLLRLGGQKDGVRYAIYALNVFNALLAIAIFLVALLKCTPFEKNWDLTLKGTCVNFSFNVASSSITILTDILVLALPFWIFLGLQMRKGAKLAVIGIFMLGLVVIAVSIARLVAVVNLGYFPSKYGNPYSIGITLNTVEVNVAVMCACAPAMRSLLKTCVPCLFSSTNRYDSQGNRYRSKYGGGTDLSRSNHRGTTAHLAGKGYGQGMAQSIALKSLRSSRNAHSALGSVHLSGSEEEMMTYNGIMRTTDVIVENGGTIADLDSDQHSTTSAELRVH